MWNWINACKIHSLILTFDQIPMCTYSSRCVRNEKWIHIEYIRLHSQPCEKRHGFSHAISCMVYELRIYLTPTKWDTMKWAKERKSEWNRRRRRKKSVKKLLGPMHESMCGAMNRELHSKFAVCMQILKYMCICRLIERHETPCVSPIARYPTWGFLFSFLFGFFLFFSIHKFNNTIIVYVL